jgi:cob(I)alamin adenosyltransferase
MAKVRRIVTKGGDDGTTTLYKVGRVPKTHPHIVALGSLDELSSWLGLVQAIDEQHGDSLEVEALHSLQEGVAACLNEVALTASGNVTEEYRVNIGHIETIERLTEEAKSRLPEENHGFILPGGKVGVAMLHVARTVVRRVERDVVVMSGDLEEGSLVLPFLNRLSDCCYALALAQQEAGA